MKEYQYSIIRRESRNPKRHRNTTTVSQSDLDALRQELTGGGRDTIVSIYTIDSDLKESIIELDLVSEALEEERRKAEERDKQYKVVVTTKGHIKDGAVVNGESDNGTPVIVHTAHVYDHFGKPKASEAQGKLTWTINKGRKTTPKERKVTGLVCKVSQADFVADGTSPRYYNIELNSNF